MVSLRSVVGSLWKIPPLQPPGLVGLRTDGLAYVAGHSRCPAISLCEMGPQSLFCAAILLGCGAPNAQRHPGGCLQNLETWDLGGKFPHDMVEPEAFYSSGSSSSGNANRLAVVGSRLIYSTQYGLPGEAPPR